MRIGFTGAQGTGKTTLLRAVENSGMGFKVVPSTARQALQAGFKVNRDADMLSQLVTTVSRCATEDSLYRQHNKTLSDRTPLDSLAYTFYQMGKVWTEKPNMYYWNISSGLAIEHMYKYDYVFYFPPYWAPKQDGVRDGDVNYQTDIDQIILDLTKDFEIDYYVMPKGTTEERLSFLTKLVD